MQGGEEDHQEVEREGGRRKGGGRGESRAKGRILIFFQNIMCFINVYVIPEHICVCLRFLVNDMEL